MSSQADKFVRLCQSCLLASSTATQTTLLKPTPLPEAAWLLVTVDFVGLFPTGENLLVCIDYYSRYPDVEIMKTITTAALEPRLRRIFARYGIPKEIVTDNAQTFCSASFAHLMDEFGIKHRRITPNYSRGIMRVLAQKLGNPLFPPFFFITNHQPPTIVPELSW